jgi:hypothetical protein
MLGQGNLGELALGQIGGSQSPIPPIPTVLRNAAATLYQTRSVSTALTLLRASAAILYDTGAKLPPLTK